MITALRSIHVRALWLLLFLLTAGALASGGCGRHRAPTAVWPPSEAEEIAQLESLLVRSGYASDSLYTLGVVTLDSPGGDSVLAFQHLPNRFESMPGGFLFSDQDGSGRPRRAVASVCKYVKADFRLLLRDGSVQKPRGNDDWFRSFIFRRADSPQAPWAVDSISSPWMLSDDKLFCTDCHTQILSVRLRSAAIGLDTLITQADVSRLVPAARPLVIPAGNAVDFDVTTLLAGDAVFLNHSGQWSQVPRAGATFSGQLVAASGARHIIIHALTDRSLTASEPNYSEYTWMIRYAGDPIALEGRGAESFRRSIGRVQGGAE